MWFDEQYAQLKIDQIHSLEIQNSIKQMREQGYTLLPNVLEAEDCKAVIDDFYQFCANNKDHADQYKMSTGRHSRLANLHGISDATLQCAMKPRLIELLDVIFDAKTALNTSLTFEQGSEQDIHRDTPFFWSKPHSGEYVGVWFALEDVQDDAGPLRYIPGGHNIRLNMEDVFQGTDARDRFLRYNQRLHEEIANRQLEEKRLLISRGDVLIWHPELPHGGSAIKNPGTTRFSMVCHYMPDGAYVLSPGVFLGLEADRNIMDYKELSTGRRMRDTGYPAFLPNY